MKHDRNAGWPAGLITTGLIAATLMLGAAGCGDAQGVPRVAVEGTVRQDGVKVAKGAVSFRPLEETSGPAAGPAVIRDGVFRLPAERGPAPGAYRVVVTLDAGGKMERMKNEVAPGDSTPAGRWQYDVKIPAGGTWHHDFELTDEHRVVAD